MIMFRDATFGDPVTAYVPGWPVDQQFREVLADGQQSSEVLIEQGSLPTVRVFGTGRTIEYTTSPRWNILDGSAVWTDWPAGVVTGGVEGRLLGAITGLRLSSGPAVTWEVVK